MSNQTDTADSNEQAREQIGDFRDAVLALAETQDLSFSVVFNALSQLASTYAFQYLLVLNGDVDEQAVLSTIERFNGQTMTVAKAGFANMRRAAEATDQGNLSI